MNRIDSPNNDTFKKLRTLTESRGIKKEGLFFIFGKNPIEDTLRSAHGHARFVLATQEQAENAHRLNQLLPTKAETIFLASPLFEELNLFGIDYPILVCTAPDWQAWEKSNEPSVLCPFQNPQNLGGALRTTLAFDFKVVLPKEAAHPLHPKSIRALSGNIFAHDIQISPSIKELEPSPQTVVVDQGGQDISKFKFPKNVMFIIGEEGQGIPENLARAPRVSIPIHSSQESLNATAALTIATYQYRVQYPLKGQ